jgi:hypothetical protein
MVDHWRSRGTQPRRPSRSPSDDAFRDNSAPEPRKKQPGGAAHRPRWGRTAPQSPPQRAPRRVAGRGRDGTRTPREQPAPSSADRASAEHARTGVWRPSELVRRATGGGAAQPKNQDDANQHDIAEPKDVVGAESGPSPYGEDSEAPPADSNLHDVADLNLTADAGGEDGSDQSPASAAWVLPPADLTISAAEVEAAEVEQGPDLSPTDPVVDAPVAEPADLTISPGEVEEGPDQSPTSAAWVLPPADLTISAAEVDEGPDQSPASAAWVLPPADLTISPSEVEDEDEQTGDEVAAAHDG